MILKLQATEESTFVNIVFTLTDFSYEHEGPSWKNRQELHCTLYREKTTLVLFRKKKISVF